MHHEKKPPENTELPREYEARPELHLVWRGLVISISEGFMSRKQAVDMLHNFDREDNQHEAVIYDLSQYRTEEPPDLVA